MGVLFEHRDEFDERNAFLQVALGLVSVAEAVSRLQPRLEATREEREAVEPLDATMCFLLGLASVSRTILAHAEAAVASSSPEARSATTPASPLPRLRSLLEV